MTQQRNATFYKVVNVVMVLSAAAFLILAILEIKDIIQVQYPSKLAFAIYWLCCGISQWQTNRKMAKTWFIFAGMYVILALFWLLFP